MKNQLNQKFKKGFGLLEVLIAALIVVTILGILITMGRLAMANSQFTLERMQATYMAQEGLEIVRQIRDTNWIDASNTTQWNTWENPSAVAGTCADYKIVLAGSVTKNWLTKSVCTPATDSEEMTIESITYKRRVTIENPATLLPDTTGNNIYSASNAVRAKVTVDWSSMGKSKTVSLSEYLTNWRPNF